MGVFYVGPAVVVLIPSGCGLKCVVIQLFRFHEILKVLTDSDEGKLHILRVVYEVWRNHPQVQ